MVTNRRLIPIACTLPTDGVQDQLARWKALAPALRRLQMHDRGVTLWFDGDAESAVRDVADREAACCAFLEFAQARERDAVRLDIECERAEGVEIAHLLAAQVGPPAGA